MLFNCISLHRGDGMKKIVFQPVLDERKRKAVVKKKVNGWKHEQYFHVHIFRRGKTCYIINTSTEEFELRKYNYSTETYCNVEYEEFHKFIDIKTESINGYNVHEWK